MNDEKSYAQYVEPSHLKKYGQYFTDHTVAAFMAEWVTQNARSLLDPAVGNSVFLNAAKKARADCSCYGYEIDPVILDYFGNPSGSLIYQQDYLRSSWEEQYDAILCNPPYHRFQSVPDREAILREIFLHTGIRYSRYTNLYILFLLKSIYQLRLGGRLAYLIPSEFLNSAYGTPIKELLLRRKLLKALINFSQDAGLFFNATTTCCILLLEENLQKEVLFYNIAAPKELERIRILPEDASAVSVSYSALSPGEKWRGYLNREQKLSYRNLLPVSAFCSIKRGIATGDNAYFCHSSETLVKYNLPFSCVTPCICRSADITGSFFTEADLIRLRQENRKVFLLDIPKEGLPSKTLLQLSPYLQKGASEGVPDKNLPSSRTPWYSMEQREPAPIWVSSACRTHIKFIRNLTDARTLTTFHNLYVRDEFVRDTDILFCYFLTKTAQSILMQNRKALGNGLIKFQPGDLLKGQMLDLTLLSKEDRLQILKIYQIIRDECTHCASTSSDDPLLPKNAARKAESTRQACLDRLEDIFRPYLL